MRKFLPFLLLISNFAYSSNSVVTATIQDPTGQAYANGTVVAHFRPTPNTPGPFTSGGANFVQDVSGTMDGTGTFTITLTDNLSIAPSGSQWTFVLCPLATVASCPQISLQVTGGAPNLSAALNAQVPTITVVGGPGINLAYKDSEVPGRKGLFYWNTTLNVLKCHNGTSWNTCSGAGAASGAVNVILDCGAKGDGTTDDYTAIQNCINNNGGHRIYFPLTATPTSGGGCVGNAYSYKISDTLILSKNGTELFGEHRNQWCGGPAISVVAAKSGVLIADTCYSCSVQHLEFDSLSVGAGTDIGIEARGGYPYISGVVVYNFGSHGIYINGTSSVNPTYQPDGWQIYDTFANSNRGDGFFAQGTDANTGRARGNHARGNTGIGFHDKASFPNAWISNQADSNGTAYKDENGIGSTWDTNYAEGNNGNPDVFAGIAQGSIVRGGWHGKLCDLSATSLALIDSSHCSTGAYAQTRNLLDLWNQRDNAAVYTIRGGATVDQDAEWQWATLGAAATPKWGIRRKTSDNTFKLWNYGTASASVSVDPTTNQWSFVGPVTASDYNGPIGNATPNTGKFTTTEYSSYKDVTEIAAPAAPAAGVERWYASSVNHLMACKRSDGSDCSPLGVTPATVISWWCTGTATPATTVYMQYGTCTPASAPLKIPMPTNGTIKNLSVKCETPGVNAASGAFVVDKFGGGATLTCTVGVGGIATPFANGCQDTVHTFNVTGGVDKLIAYFTTQGGETLADCMVTVEKQ